ncbi:hypothetical protein BBD42_14345 [Paenibacillus sp. BIHB 4019]|uniref:Uncharacterized protein n=1 Tax=Paenibacillus sp. BIHB 4019 TaxID=1870819 RepID=A0A1B2DIH4_9BACL|nr:RHS repeat domain-containing protein [Paenibacillus sp. BIHB 4019]ANY67522.1 hypothetical protein BBD42_14345 [Paenibacillus sp. BIHB 4019]
MMPRSGWWHGGQTQYKWDTADNLVAVTDALGRTERFGYGGLDRVNAVWDASGVQVAQPDHVWELQLGGPDTVKNLKFLDTFTNWHIGVKQIRPQIRDLPTGTKIKIKSDRGG